MLIALLIESPWLILLSYFVSGVGIELFNIPWFTSIQNEMPSALLGRISALDFLVSYGLAPLGLLLLPLSIAAIGQSSVLIICAAFVMVTPLIMLAVPGAIYLREVASGSGPKLGRLKHPESPQRKSVSRR